MTNTATTTYTLGPCEKCHGPEICCFPAKRNICGDCRQDEHTAADHGGQPEWATN